MNKKAQFDLSDINWAAFIILVGIGFFTVIVMLSGWKRFEYGTPIYVKIILLISVIPASYIMTKIFFPD